MAKKKKTRSAALKKKKTGSVGRKKKAVKAKKKPADSTPVCPVPKALSQHEWLQRLVGKWTFETECDMGPGNPPMTGKGSETVRAIGELWTHTEARWNMPGAGRMTSIMGLGFDPQKKCFVGSWYCSMMTNQWEYRGKLDKAGKVLTLNTEGPHMLDFSKTAKYRDVITIKSGDRRELTSYMLTDKGKWQKLMSAHYTRKK